MLDLQGRSVQPFASAKAKLHVFIFARADCPISNAYAPEIRRLYSAFQDQGVGFTLVYSGMEESAERLQKHLDEFRYPCTALRDPRGQFAAQAQVQVTPEAAIFDRNGALLYHGRIDDLYADLGQKRPTPSDRTLENALHLALSGRPVPPAAGPAIGCIIEEAIQ